MSGVTPTITGAGTGIANTFTVPQTFATTETAAASARPVQQSQNYLAQPATAPGIAADYHGIDLLVRSDSANFNANCSLYPIEANAQLDVGAGGANRLVAVYGYVNNLSNGNVTGDMTSFQALQRNLGTGTVALLRGHRIRTPVNSGGGTVTSVRAVDIEDQTGVATDANTWAIYSAGGKSFHKGYLGLGTASVPSAMLHLGPVADADIGLFVQARASQSGELISVKNSSSVSLFKVASDGLASIRSLTNGTQLSVQGPASNTNLSVLDGTLSANLGVDATGAFVKSGAASTQLRLIQGATGRMTINASGNISFNSANKPTLPADATDPASVITLANALKSALVLYTLAA